VGAAAPAQPQPVRRARRGVRRQLLSSYLNSPADAQLAPAPEVVRRFARAIGRPTSELMALAGYGDAEDPFLDRAEAVHFVLAVLDARGGALASSAELATCRRVPESLRADPDTSEHAHKDQHEEPSGVPAARAVTDVPGGVEAVVAAGSSAKG